MGRIRRHMDEGGGGTGHAVGPGEDADAGTGEEMDVDSPDELPPDPASAVRRRGRLRLV